MRSNIEAENTYLGIEFGSTRIKAVLLDGTYSVLASGSYTWENQFKNGYWTYSQKMIEQGLQECFRSLSDHVMQQYGVPLTTVGAIGISGMMHGYLAFDKNDNLLVPFRTWRNTTTEQAADRLTDLFGFNIPQRWSIAHLYQAMLNGEVHVPQIAHITTLAGYIHYRLTGRYEVGIGEASGIFPIENGVYNPKMIKAFQELSASAGYRWDICDLLPQIRRAGEKGAYLTKEGAAFLDSTGALQEGIPFCPPEGDASTGMVATNSVRPATGNVSAGTSVFSMLVLERPLKDFYREIDVVTTPDGAPVAMVHCNNGCSELDAWIGIFEEFSKLKGISVDRSELYELLYRNTVHADVDCGGVVSYNFLASEPVANVAQGTPTYYRLGNTKLTLANFFKSQLYATVATLRLGMDILFQQEEVRAKSFSAHGGLFKVEGIAQQILADALNTPISVQTTAGEGGAWGMALLAAYMLRGAEKSLADWLDSEVFLKSQSITLSPNENTRAGFNAYMKHYRMGLEKLY